jgi:hypothetical protein
MRTEPDHITTAFAPETRFVIEPRPADQPFEIPELLVLPMEDQPIRTSIAFAEPKGIPFSAIND